MPFASIEEAAADLREGRMIIIVDDEDRENEGDLVCAAELITPEKINFMATHARGLICMPLTEERCDELHLTMQVADNTSFLGTAFTVSIEARKGVTTGISAADRATTILTAVDPKTRPQDLARPGHVFPLRAKKGGVLVRPGQTEASVDLARIAGLDPSAVICEIMNEDGTMARMPQLEAFASRHDLKIITVADLVRYRMRKEILVRRAVETDLPTVYGMFRAVAFENALSEEVHLAMVMGDVRTDEAVLVRVHTENVTCDMFGYVAGGRTPTGRDVVAWAREAVGRGAGEILLTSMDADGTTDGYDLGLTRAVSDAVGVPVIASGGAGTLEHLAEALHAGADAALAASIFHYGTFRVREAKAHLAAAGIAVRP